MADVEVAALTTDSGDTSIVISVPEHNHVESPDVEGGPRTRTPTSSDNPPHIHRERSRSLASSKARRIHTINNAVMQRILTAVLFFVIMIAVDVFVYVWFQANTLRRDDVRGLVVVDTESWAWRHHVHAFTTLFIANVVATFLLVDSVTDFATLRSIWKTLWNGKASKTA